jgi:pyruvate dehydrogenase E2 component (dihydrolipoamide acetyltransferase)
MAELMRMPEISANMESAILASWSVAPGTTFAVGEIIAVIETEKAVVDYEAESAGVLVRALALEGSEVAVGDPIALIAAVGEVIDDPDAVLAQLGGVSHEQALVSNSEPALPSAGAASSASAPSVSAPSVAVLLVEADGSGRQFSSPLARKLAREANIDLGPVVGSGPNGRIVRRDVQSAIAAHSSSGRASVPEAQSSVLVATETSRDIPHTKLRKIIASRLIESKTTAPHFYVRGTANIGDLLRMREQINEGASARVSVNDILIKAMAKAHAAVPALNVIWTPDSIRHFSSVDISVAISTERGLVTPVIRGVDRLSVTEISMTVKDFAERAKEGRLQQQELEGGTTTISNLGMFGTEEFTAIINPPQASILAVGAGRDVPVVKDGAVSIGTVASFVLSVDHRPVDGVDAAQWMKVFRELLEHPAKILA